MPGFVLLILGDGPEMTRLRESCNGFDWIHVLGAKRGREKALCHRVAQLLICPGALGLQVLDSFTAQLPIITFAQSLHGPEFSYLKDGDNSIVVQGNDCGLFAERVASLLRDDNQLQSMRRACAIAAGMYTLHHMVEKFSVGIENSLQTCS